MPAFKRLAFSLALTLLVSKALAVWMTPLAIEDMTRQSDLVLHATVTSKVCEKLVDGRIITRVQLDVEEVLKGNLATNKFTVVHGGGTVGNLRTEVSGQVEYEVGEEIVAFLVINPQGNGVTLGLAQGKFHVWKDKQTGEKFAHNPFHGVSDKEAEREDKKAAKLELKSLSRTAKGATK